LKALDGREITRFDGTRVALKLGGEQVVTVTMNWRQRVLSLIARPEVLFLLLLGALAGARLLRGRRS
jgi:membrane-bound serine protease (ClpP class)